MKRRLPWWLILIAACYTGHIGFLLFMELWQAEPIGIHVQWGRGPLRVTGVDPDSPGARAGLRPQDRILQFNGLPVTSYWHYLRALLGNVEPGIPINLEVERNGARHNTTLTMTRSPNRWRRFTSASEWVRLLNGLALMLMAAVIAFSRPNDSVALIGALFLADAGCNALELFHEYPGLFVAARKLPTWLAFLLLLARPSLLLGATVPTFAAAFPRQLFRARWPWFAIWLPPAVLSPYVIYYGVYAPLLTPAAATKTLDLRIFLPVALINLLAGITMWVAHYRRLEDVNDKRRARVVMAGCIIPVVVVFPRFLMLSGGPLAQQTFGYASWPLDILRILFPLAMAYAILRQRVFDLPLILRQGVQYAMARGALRAVVPLLGVVLLADVLLHGEQSLFAILTERGWIYLALALLAVVAHAKRRAWLESLDRRFFRERYNAQQLLREIADEAGRADGIEEVALLVAQRVMAALHSRTVVLFVREQGQPCFRTLFAGLATAMHPDPPSPEISADSKLAGVLRLLARPIDVSGSREAWSQLPESENAPLRDAGIEWLIPIAMNPQDREALLALGPKLSEEPYSREDLDLLMTMSANLRLLMRRAPAAPPAVGPALTAECPNCGMISVGTGRACACSGIILQPLGVPAVLVERYRLIRRLGRGGMGAVYEGRDEMLDRSVAVKVMRPDVDDVIEATRRFRREAHLVASFTHSNVVTVYDFGVAAGEHPFLVLELLEGTNLREEIRRRGVLQPAHALEIMRGVCSAVNAAHQRRILHRDLKPENIFLTQGTVKVLDFGVAKSLGRPLDATISMAGTQTGQLVGTLHYMAPEQLAAADATESWDVWALSIIVYEMITGSYPFEAPSITAWHDAVRSSRFAPLPEGIQASTRLNQFFGRAFASDKRLRPESAPALLAEFEGAIRDP